MYKIYETLIQTFFNTYMFYSIQAGVQEHVMAHFLCLKCGTV